MSTSFIFSYFLKVGSGLVFNTFIKPLEEKKNNYIWCASLGKEVIKDEGHIHYMYARKQNCLQDAFSLWGMLNIPPWVIFSGL